MNTIEEQHFNQKPIGVFDSGIGGTSIWKEIVALLSNENSIYLADSANAPYGLKSKDEIIALCEKNTELLLSKNSKLIVVACNTATTNAIQHLRAKYTIPFIGIEPAIKPALLKTKTNTIGILATKGTLASDLFHKTAKLWSKNIKIIEQDGSGIVELIENGKINSKKMLALLKQYMLPMQKHSIDYLVLGCSHYPYLIPKLSKILSEKVKIIDSGLAVAQQTKKVLESNGLLNSIERKPTHIFYSNGNPSVLSTILKNSQKVEYLKF